MSAEARVVSGEDPAVPADSPRPAVDPSAAGEPAGAGERIVDPWVDLGADLAVDERFVKCWVETIPPGESRPAHVHRHPWISVVLSGATGESYTHDGRLMGRGEAVTGTIRFNGPGVLPYGHYFKNVSEDRTLMMVAVEIRVPGGTDAWAAGEQDAPSAPDQPRADQPGADQPAPDRPGADGPR